MKAKRQDYWQTRVHLIRFIAIVYSTSLLNRINPPPAAAAAQQHQLVKETIIDLVMNTP